MTAWNDPQLVVLDTLSALTGHDPDPERRDGLPCFLLHLKQRHRAVLMVDHANKRGALSGTARRASAADVVMALRRPSGSQPSAGGNARFDIHFEKTRQRVPPMPIRAELQTVDGAGLWRWTAGDGRVERLAALVGRGLGRRDVCAALGIGRTSFFKLKAEARVRGLVPGRTS
jgi:hypothetical protein